MRKAQKHSTNATESQSGNGQTRNSTRAGPRPDGRQPRAANKQGGEGGGGGGEGRCREELRSWQLPESIRIVSSSWGIRLASNLFDVSIRVAIFSSLAAPSLSLHSPPLPLLADEICKSNYKNHRAEFSHGNAMGSWLGTPFPTPNQTQRNRPANCQTSNDEMKSNRNSPRSRAALGRAGQLLNKVSDASQLAMHVHVSVLVPVPVPVPVHVRIHV